MSDKTKIYETVMDILADVTGDEVVKEDPDINLPEEGLIDSDRKSTRLNSSHP